MHFFDLFTPSEICFYTQILYSFPGRNGFKQFTLLDGKRDFPDNSFVCVWSFFNIYSYCIFFVCLALLEYKSNIEFVNMKMKINMYSMAKQILIENLNIRKVSTLLQKSFSLIKKIFMNKRNICSYLLKNLSEFPQLLIGPLLRISSSKGRHHRWAPERGSSIEMKILRPSQLHFYFLHPSLSLQQISFHYSQDFLQFFSYYLSTLIIIQFFFANFAV